MINPKKKGNSFELQCIKIFKELTGEEINSSRNINRMLDNQGVDFETNEYYIQCKAVEKNIDNHKIIENMKEGKTKLLLHKKNRKGILVTMELKTFLDFYKKN